jgi:hypothetical protein
MHDFAGVSFAENISALLAGFALGKAGAIGYHAWKRTEQHMRVFLHHLSTDAQSARRI